MSNFEDFLGHHELTGVQYGYKDEAQALAFILDGTTYAAIEDEVDGYRSCLGDIITWDDAVTNTFAPIPVLVAIPVNPDLDVLDFIDTRTNRVILTIGTDNTHDYYPSFVSDWRPDLLP